jgi:hypothetical protein
MLEAGPQNSTTRNRLHPPKLGYLSNKNHSAVEERQPKVPTVVFLQFGFEFHEITVFEVGKFWRQNPGSGT